MYNRFAKNDEVAILLKESSHTFFITFAKFRKISATFLKQDLSRDMYRRKLEMYCKRKKRGRNALCIKRLGYDIVVKLARLTAIRNSPSRS